MLVGRHMCRRVFMTTVYETIRVRNGRLPFIDRHIERLRGGCAAVGMPPPRALGARLDELGLGDRPDRALRVEWDGSTLDISERPVPSTAPLALVTSSVPHPGYAVKTTARTAFEQAQAEARQNGADEGLLLTADGAVAEGTLFAICWFEGAVLRVPSLDLGILPSIGRDRVIELVGQIGLDVEPGCFARELLEGRPAFITTSVRGVVGVAMLDGVRVPHDPRIKQLRDAFWPS